MSITKELVNFYEPAVPGTEEAIVQDFLKLYAFSDFESEKEFRDLFKAYFRKKGHVPEDEDDVISEVIKHMFYKSWLCR